jgi:hypothetical protein
MWGRPTHVLQPIKSFFGKTETPVHQAKRKKEQMCSESTTCRRLISENTAVDKKREKGRKRGEENTKASIKRKKKTSLTRDCTSETSALCGRNTMWSAAFGNLLAMTRREKKR